MMTPRDNPERNQLPKGIPPEKLTDAVRRSGYPLQSDVADSLKDQFCVYEEWGYLDPIREKQRSLDIYAYRDINRPEPSAPIATALALLIECKRSSMPYVFFRSVSPRKKAPYPHIAGVPVSHETVERELKLSETDFVRNGPPVCAIVSHAARKGKEFELTGTRAFNGIVRPLLGASEFMEEYFQTVRPQSAYTVTILMPIAVVDAPMMLSQGGPEDATLSPAPWVRLERDEVRKHSQSPRGVRRRSHVIDVVHRDYLATFIQQDLLPLAETVAARATERLPISAALKS